MGFRPRIAMLGVVFILGSTLPVAAYTVTNLADSGGGSLRQAILDANANSGADVVTFQAGLSGTIFLTTGEIAITDSVDIQGPGARTLAVDGNARIFNISGDTSVNVTISGLTLTGASATGNGGAIANSGANVTLRADTVSGNNATGEGGAIYHLANSGWFTIESSTVSGNTANKAGAIYSTGWNLVIRNSTISGNHATDSIGGIKLEFAYASIYNSTIAGNWSDYQLGGTGGIGLNSTQLDLESTIVAGNTDVTGASDLKRLNGTVNATNCLFGQAVGVADLNGTNTANLIGVDPLLGPLAANGGPTDTHALPAGSQAIDAGSNSQGLSTDQRGLGYQRFVGLGPDIGAFEYNAGVLIPALSRVGVGGLIGLLLAVGVLALLRRP